LGSSASCNLTERNAPLRGVVQRVGREHPARGQARDLADAGGAHAAWAVALDDVERAKAQARAGIERDSRIEPRARMIGDDILGGDPCLGMACRAPALDARARGLANQRRPGRLAGAEPLGQPGGRGQRGHPGAAKDKARTAGHGDLDSPDLAGWRQRRDIGGLAPVHADGNDAAVIALGIKHADEAGVIGLRGGDQVLRGAVFLRRSGDAQRGRAQPVGERVRGLRGGQAQLGRAQGQCGERSQHQRQP
jgi:hypothetical protein